MAHLSTSRIGLCGIGGLDSSNRAPIENLATEPGGPAFGIVNNCVKVAYWTPAALAANNIATAQVATSTVNLTAGAGTTAVVINGISYIDITGYTYGERNVRVTGVAGTTAVNITVNGLDMFGQPVTNTFLGPAGATTTASTKTFRYIRSITVAATTTNNITVGTGDVFGFPALTPQFDCALIFWANALITASTGFTAPDLNTATATTGAVRGTYAVQSASNGTNRLRMVTFLDNPDNMNTAYGVQQFSA